MNVPSVNAGTIASQRAAQFRRDIDIGGRYIRWLGQDDSRRDRVIASYSPELRRGSSRYPIIRFILRVYATGGSRIRGGGRRDPSG